MKQSLKFIKLVVNRNSQWSRVLFFLGMWSQVLINGCSDTSFGGNASQKNPGPQPKVTLTPQSTPVPQNTPLVSPPERPSPVCSSNYKPLRVSFIVDNSGSHGTSASKPGFVIQNPDLPNASLVGSDPVVETQSIRGKKEVLTRRQESIYSVVKQILDADKTAKKADTNFPGSSVSLAYFPKNNTFEGFSQFVTLFGDSLFGFKYSFPQANVNLSQISNDGLFLEGLWKDLSFTHHSEGTTPYATALEAGTHQMKDSQANDSGREKYVFLITDGLPNDQLPSKVIQAKQELAKHAKLVVVSVFNSTKESLRTSEAYKQLKKSYEDPNVKWGNTPGSSDSFTSFDAYWDRLVALPKEIADEYHELEGVGGLKEKLVNIIKDKQICGTP